MGKPVLRKASRQRNRVQRRTDRHSADYWIRKLAEQKDADPAYAEFCARTFYDISADEEHARAVQTIREEVRDRLVSADELLKIVAIAEGTTPTQARADTRRCREMFEERGQTPA